MSLAVFVSLTCSLAAQQLAGTLDEQLLTAVASGQANAVQELLVQGADANARNRTGNTALMLAAYQGSVTMMEALLVAGAKVNQKRSDGVTALMIAGAAAQPVAAEILAARGAKSGRSDTHDALLLNAGVTPSAEDVLPRLLALSQAIAMGEEDVVRLLRTELLVQFPDAKSEETGSATIRPGYVRSAKLVRQARPMYPNVARQNWVEGTIQTKGIIAEDGTIGALEPVSGPPVLLMPALAAVAKWRYEPCTLNGEPVAVYTVLDVNFQLR